MLEIQQTSIRLDKLWYMAAIQTITICYFEIRISKKFSTALGVKGVKNLRFMV
jgi:hypothetical protein